ncbi:DNA-binding protein [Pseudomonas sp. MYb185]|uniref:DNA-binding protein n=1 Tax=Pseudomonas sp. MYb185 TaxID=1848729 RepID=UPI000CFE22F7|nr:DNA-binding protein [Pseudomonas sp. MYb185]PRB79013.1 DNA-binding protein [Pseudomonas sp. MYb185]
MENTRQQFAERLQQALKHAGYAPKPAVLEREFNLRYLGKPMTLHGVRRWLKGETLPSEDKLLVLARWLKVDVRELRFGEQVSHQVRERQLPYPEIPHREQEVIEMFLELSPSRRQVICDVIMTFALAEQAQFGTPPAKPDNDQENTTAEQDPA